jgi:hypothetical protein
MHFIVPTAVRFPLLPPLATDPLGATPVTNAIRYPRQELSLLPSPPIIPNFRYVPTRANYSFSFLRGVRTGARFRPPGNAGLMDSQGNSRRAWRVAPVPWTGTLIAVCGPFKLQQDVLIWLDR